MAEAKGLEEKLNEIFVDKAPFQLPENAKKWIVEYLPYINLVLGIFALWGALGLYRWATTANKLVDYANELARSFGVENTAATSRLSIWVWLSIIVLAAQGVIYVISFQKVKAKEKSGWNLLYIALLAYAVYGFLTLFIDTYGGVGNLIGYLLGTVLGLYFLFQIRSHYLSAKPAKSVSSNTESGKVKPKTASKK